MTQNDTDGNSKTYELKAGQMLRYEVTGPVLLSILEGKGEIFGKELVTGRELSLEKDDRGTLVTFHGCRVAIKGGHAIAFVMDTSEDQEIPNIYLNIHANLEKLREKAKTDQTRGPCVLVCGYDSVGKTTLCTNLVNYAARKGHRPILVDLNVCLNNICVPGTICALSVTKPWDLKLKWSQEEEPLVYCLGEIDPSANLNLYHEQISRLAEMISIRAENDSKIFHSGYVINMGGFRKDIASIPFTQQKGIQTIKRIVAAFEVDTIIVIEDGFLAEFLRTELDKSTVILRLPKSSGVVTRIPEQWVKQRDDRIVAYFHGESKESPCYPHKLTLSIDEFEVYKVGSEAIPDALLPHGAEEEDTWRKVIKICLTKELKNRVLAVSQASEPELIPDTTIYGFLVVIDVMPESGSFTVLSPCAEEPPNYLLRTTSLSYVDPDDR